MAKKQRIPHKFLPWIDARKKFRLSNAHIQMARELGLSPKRFGDYADTTDQPWKVPQPQFIENQYEKQFGKERGGPRRQACPTQGGKPEQGGKAESQSERISARPTSKHF